MQMVLIFWFFYLAALMLFESVKKRKIEANERLAIAVGVFLLTVLTDTFQKYVIVTIFGMSYVQENLIQIVGYNVTIPLLLIGVVILLINKRVSYQFTNNRMVQLICAGSLITLYYSAGLLVTAFISSYANIVVRNMLLRWQYKIQYIYLILFIILAIVWALKFVKVVPRDDEEM